MAELKNYEFKDMATIDVAEAVSESAHVLIEDGGVIKRMSKSAVGKVKTVNGTEPDENGNIEVETASSSSWNDLTDKPFYSEVKDVFYLEETTVSGFDNPSGDYWTVWMLDEPLKLSNQIKVGEKYIVTWDGVDYEATLFEDEAGSYLGINYYGYGYDDSFPFGFWINQWDGTIKCVLSITDEESHAFSIRKVEEVTKKLDSKYHTTVFYMPYGDDYIYKDKACTTPPSWTELVDATENGNVVLKKFTSDKTGYTMYPLYNFDNKEDKVRINFDYGDIYYSVYK